MEKNIFTTETGALGLDSKATSTCSSLYCCTRKLLQLSLIVILLLFVGTFETIAQITVDGNPSDWPTTFANPAITVKQKVTDPVNSTLDNIWTQGSSAVNDVDTWVWTNNSANDKGDIHNAGVALIGTTVYFFLDRYANNGDEAAGIWFFVNSVSLNNDGSFSGLHTNGDILITSHFINGGTVGERHAYIWTDGVLVERIIADIVLSVATNTVEVAAPAAWNFTPKSGTPGFYPENAFMEGFIDLGSPEFADIDICFSTFLIETRNSQSLSASLEDLVVGAFATTPTVLINNVTACAGGSAMFTASANGGIPPYEYSFNGGAYSATNTFTINPVTTSTQVTVTARGSQGCISDPAIGTLTVNDVSGGTIAGDQTLCTPFDPAAFTSTVPGSGSGTVTYQWQSNTTGCGSAFTDINGATSETYDASAVAETTYYRRVTTSTLDGVVCSENSNCLTVTPNNIAPGSIEGDQTLCSPFNPAAFTSVAATGSGTITYQWQLSTTSAVAGFADINGATSATFDMGPITVTNWFKRIATSTLNSVECAADSNVLTVTPNNIDPGSIEGDQTLCTPFNPAAFTSVAATGSGTITYQWQLSTTSADAGFADINGATSATFDMGPITVTNWFKRIATSTLNGVACAADSNVLTVTPNNIDPGSIEGDQTLCTPFNPAAFTSVAAMGSGAITYQWQSNTTGCGNAFSNINGATSATYDAPAVAVTTYFRRVATSTLNGVPCSDNSNCLTVTPNNITPGSIEGDQTGCAPFNPATFTSVAAMGSGAITYQWQSNTTGCLEAFTNINGAISATYDAPAVAETTYYRRVATSTLNGVQCSENSNCLTATPAGVTPGVIAGDQTLCTPFNPAAFTNTTSATGDGVVTYQWQSGTAGCGGAFSNINGATSATYDAPAVAVTTYFRRVATSTLNGVPCVANSNCLTVTPNNITPGSIEGNQTLCTPFNPAAFTSVTATGSGAITYQWQSNTTGCGNAFSNINGATSATYDAPAVAVTTYFRRVATSTLNGVPCSDNSNCLTVTPNNIDPGSIEGDQTLCTPFNPAAFTSVAAMGSGAITYQWQINTTGCGNAFSNINGATSATYDAPAVAVTTYFRRVATSTLNGVPCSDNSNCLTVTPNNITPGSIEGNQTLCTPFNPAAFTSVAAMGSGAITYQWQSNTTGCGNAFSNINGATSATYDAPAVAVTTYFRRVATSTLNGVPCSDNSNCLTVTPNAITPGSITGIQTVCIGSDPIAFTSVNATGGGAITYQWQTNTTGCLAAFTNINGATSATYDPGIANVTTYYRRVATSTLNGVPCAANSNCLTVTVETCGGAICTYTQGYYGNLGGMACTPDGSLTTTQLITQSINNWGGTLYLGRGANALATGGSFTTTSSASDVNMLITLLPGGGPSNLLNGDYNPYNVLPIRRGRIFNNLLSQSITLALNIGITTDPSASVGNFDLTGSGGNYIVTQSKTSESSCDAPEQASCVLQPNSLKSYYMPANVIDALPAPKHVSDLLQLAKNALGGLLPVGVSYSDVTNAVDAINNAFDGCRFFVEFSNASVLCPEPVIAKTIEVKSTFDVSIYPVPFKDNLTLVYDFDSKSKVNIEIFDIRGVLLLSQTDSDVYVNKELKIDLNFRASQNQVYFVRITADDRSITKKIISKQ